MLLFVAVVFFCSCLLVVEIGDVFLAAARDSCSS